MAVAKKFWNVKKDGTIVPLKRVVSGGHIWMYVTAIWARDLRGSELALKQENYYVLFVKFRENPVAYLVYKRKGKGSYIKRDVMGRIVDW